MELDATSMELLGFFPDSFPSGSGQNLSIPERLPVMSDLSVQIPYVRIAKTRWGWSPLPGGEHQGESYQIRGQKSRQFGKCDICHMSDLSLDIIMPP